MAKRKEKLSREEWLKKQEEEVRQSCLIIEKVQYPRVGFMRTVLSGNGYESDDLSGSDLYGIEENSDLIPFLPAY